MPGAAGWMGGPRSGLRQHGVGVADADQVVCAEGSAYCCSTQVLVLVLAESGDGLDGQTRKQTRLLTIGEECS